MTSSTASQGEPVRVELGSRSYSVVVERRAHDDCGERLRGLSQASRAHVVTDENVDALHGKRVRDSLEGAGFRVSGSVVPAGEASKSLALVEKLFADLAAAEIERRDLVVALGGGVVGDLAAFAASTFRRGIAVAQLPTSLMAQVDSAIGGKTGVNLAAGKNLAGTFHQPITVLCDPDTLTTLPDGEYRSGLAEVVKYGIIRDAALFELLETRRADVAARDAELVASLVARCAAIKAAVVTEDEHETLGTRLLLNLGHTVGHALEAIHGYGELRHGEAVAIGTVCACRAAVGEGLMKASDATRVTSLLEALGLPVSAPSSVDPVSLIAYLRQDKKRAGDTTQFILPVGIGDARVQPLTDDQVLATL